MLYRYEKAVTQIPGSLTLQTEMPPERLLSVLRQWEPWRHEICFSNGVRTSQLRTGAPYTDRPLRKVQKILSRIPVDAIHGNRALDIGCNSGYNSVYLAQEYRMSVTGIDVSQRHLDVSRFLATLARGGQTEFVKQDATFFVMPEEFDLILHFGTLYHLANPVLSIENAAKSLKPGGFIGLETSCYTGEDPDLCRWIKGVNNDQSNWWALSKPVLEEILRLHGFREVALVSESVLNKPWSKAKGLSRVLFVARK